ncbi:putative transporter -like protein [Emericellopsis cladophorae]|uniref:Transporter -like protein n=1 Tax=Emericellopsis cladophorae TaxID=2686198 RepID=A0A9Q0BDC6_9HYPO|nr:putative transporter -like protein [Emericellopsis cladophorae]KAI6780410.1 putative transporter -like protein [Emericellopsis cladophorae]
MASSHHHLMTASPGGGSAPGELSPSFAQTGAEFSLDDSDVDDFDLHDQARDGRDDDAYEMRAPRRAEHWDAGDDDKLTTDSSVDSFQLYTPDEEMAVRRKFDRRLVLFVALLYMLSFLDRSNIGNARIAGMDTDLQSTPARADWYEWALTSFYISYIAFEWMSLLWKVIPAHIYVSMLVLSWGLLASLQAVATSYPVLIALRTLLGIGEAGFTGIPFYLSFFFKRHELAFRTALFISAAPLATSFASVLAWAIVRVGEHSPIAPWRLLFLIEGFPSVIVSVIAWSVIPDSPQTASYLTKREKKVARLRLRAEQPSSSSSTKPTSGLKLVEALAVLKDPVAWLPACMFFLTNMAYSSLPVFLPKILTDMGHDALSAQALSAPPYLLSFIVVLLTARLSDRLRARTPLIVFHAAASCAGYAALAFAEPLALSATLRYIAVYPAAVGFFNVVTLLITWTINNQPSSSRQGSGFALMQLVGQCGPLVGTRLYPDKDAPYYGPGMRTCAGAMLLVTLLAIALRFFLQYRNRKLDKEEQAMGEHGSLVEEEGLVGSGRKKTTGQPFRYML